MRSYPEASGADADAGYVVQTATPTLPNERVLTDTATVAWDFGTPGEVKAVALGSAVADANYGDLTVSGSGSVWALNASGVTAATKGSATKAPQITVDLKGRVTALTDITIAPAWASVTGTPTTLAGYGIIDAQGLDAGLTSLVAADASAGFPRVTAANTWTSEDAPSHRTALGLGSMAVVADAPSDGSTYGRLNGAWAVAGGGSGLTQAQVLARASVGF